ncbi:TPA: hypothetical protein JLK35_003400 [Escherichia coli]|nr:hypothetical protein [Escherichia coli]
MFPAPAGINRRSRQFAAHWQRVPRASGDKPLSVSAALLDWSCSPRQRG